MNPEKSESLHLGFAKITLTKRDRQVFNVMAMVFLPMLAAAAINAFRADELHLVLSHCGLVLVLISYLVGREGLRIFAAEPGSNSEKILVLLTFGGVFTTATGWAYRMLY